MDLFVIGGLDDEHGAWRIRFIILACLLVRSPGFGAFIGYVIAVQPIHGPFCISTILSACLLQFGCLKLNLLTSHFWLEN